MQYRILGTAGHIDHGKSALVKALTGIDPDRLKEEKERGITIDLGFADLRFSDDLTVGIVDVPGHERLIRNMLAGAGGIDLVLLVIAADEGVMPQSREHLHICNLLDIKAGLIVISKVDLVEQEWLDLVQEDVRNFVKGTFLEGADIIPVSAKTMFNTNLLKEKIKEVALKVEQKSSKGIFRLPVDRVFSLKGFGTVVTGTAVSGSISVNSDVEILPSNITCKVRGLHSHGKPIQSANAGQRVAINLQGVEKEALKRGDAAVVPGKFISTKMLDAKIELLQNVPVLKSREIVHLHLGTTENMARIILYEKAKIAPGEICYCQFRLQEPIIAMSGDRFIIRRFSPLETVGGGQILDPISQKMSHKKSLEYLHVFDSGTLLEKIAAKVKRSGVQGNSISSVEGWINSDILSIHESVEHLKEDHILIQHEDILLHKNIFDTFERLARKELEEFHKKYPLKPGIPKEELRGFLNIPLKLFNYMISLSNNLVLEKEAVRLSTYNVALTSEDEQIKIKILSILEQSKLQPPTREELSPLLGVDQKYLTDILKLMTREGRLIRINDSLYLAASVYGQLLESMKVFFENAAELSVQDFKKVFGAPRKYAITFLGYLDAQKVTRRIGDIRKTYLN